MRRSRLLVRSVRVTVRRAMTDLGENAWHVMGVHARDHLATQVVAVSCGTTHLGHINSLGVRAGQVITIGFLATRGPDFTLDAIFEAGGAWVTSALALPPPVCDASGDAGFPGGHSASQGDGILCWSRSRCSWDERFVPGHTRCART